MHCYYLQVFELLRAYQPPSLRKDNKVDIMPVRGGGRGVAGIKGPDVCVKHADGQEDKDGHRGPSMYYVMRGLLKELAKNLRGFQDETLTPSDKEFSPSHYAPVADRSDDANYSSARNLVFGARNALLKELESTVNFKTGLELYVLCVLSMSNCI